MDSVRKGCDSCHGPKAQWITKDIKLCTECVLRIQKEKYEAKEYGIR